MTFSETTKYEILETGLGVIAGQLERLAEAIENGAGGGTCYYPPRGKGGITAFVPTRIRPSEVPGTDSLATRALAALQAQEGRNLEYQEEAFKAILRDKFGVDTKGVSPYVRGDDPYIMWADFDTFCLGIWRNSDGSVGDLYYMPESAKGGIGGKHIITDLADLGHHLKKDIAAAAARQARFDSGLYDAGYGLE